MLEEIRQLFLDTVSASYTPTVWRQSKVIFIPKSGKADYSIAKAYRPISLTPFLFKTLERLCFWHAHEKALEKIPIHKRQYAYKAGMGTETAISKVLDTIEKGMMKCMGCSDYINERTMNRDAFIHVGQEPYCHNGMIKGLDKNHQILNKGLNSRAYIYAHKFIPIMFDSDRSDRDTCTALWLTKDPQIPKIQVISSYWDGGSEDLPQTLLDSLQHGKNLNMDMLIGMDSNAHTDVTGSNYTDARGAKLEQLILRHNMVIINKGDKPTFESHVGKSHIDVTLATPRLAANRGRGVTLTFNLVIMAITNRTLLPKIHFQHLAVLNEALIDMQLKR